MLQAMHRLERTAGHVVGAAAAAAAPSRQFVIAEVPNGALEPRHFALEPAEPAALGDGAVRVKVEALTIGAGQRGIRWRGEGRVQRCYDGDTLTHDPQPPPSRPSLP